ncbi:hypothetical protein BV898_14673 [Hypsibius exemplaris]|uniref:Uncharacterized protein n=1 Tax=Hypsibius exemplaris TaxID=2072580 RepID=A0A9X6RJJ2_HYPEX|nr:hypothetical protein BV898_14673 [Hypsibius exemplaris]
MTTLRRIIGVNFDLLTVIFGQILTWAALSLAGPVPILSISLSNLTAGNCTSIETCQLQHMPDFLVGTRRDGGGSSHGGGGLFGFNGLLQNYLLLNLWQQVLSRPGPGREPAPSGDGGTITDASLGQTPPGAAAPSPSAPAVPMTDPEGSFMGSGDGGGSGTGPSIPPNHNTPASSTPGFRPMTTAMLIAMMPLFTMSTMGSGGSSGEWDGD